MFFSLKYSNYFRKHECEMISLIPKEVALQKREKLWFLPQILILIGHYIGQTKTTNCAMVSASLAYPCFCYFG